MKKLLPNKDLECIDQYLPDQTPQFNVSGNSPTIFRQNGGLKKLITFKSKEDDPFDILI